MFAVIYGVLGDDDSGNLSIDGPFFHKCDNDLVAAEIQAKELANVKTKNQIIPWVFKIEEGESIADAMARIKIGWFQRFKNRTMETFKTVQKDQTNSTCPFVDLDIDRFISQLD